MQWKIGLLLVTSQLNFNDNQNQESFILFTILNIATGSHQSNQCKRLVTQSVTNITSIASYDAKQVQWEGGISLEGKRNDSYLS